MINAQCNAITLEDVQRWIYDEKERCLCISIHEQYDRNGKIVFVRKKSLTGVDVVYEFTKNGELSFMFGVEEDSDLHTVFPMAIPYFTKDGNLPILEDPQISFFTRRRHSESVGSMRRKIESRINVLLKRMSEVQNEKH